MSVRTAFVAAGVTAARASAEAPRAEKAMLEFGITTQHEGAAFLAQVLHESVLLAFFEEIASGREYEGRKDLGNTHPGDGPRYKGRGPIQLTGRSNYRAAGRALGLSLESHPELASHHDVGWRIAGWYWKTRGLDRYADGSQHGFDEITLRINGGFNGKASRDRLWRIVRSHDCRPADPLAGFMKDERGWIREYDSKKTSAARRKVVRGHLKDRRKRIWHAAEADPRGRTVGWAKYNRHARYAAFLGRTT